MVAYHIFNSWLYSVLLHYYFGQTLGKRLLGVTVLDNQTEERITLRQAFLRDIVIIVINVLLMLLALYVVFVGKAIKSEIFQMAQIGLSYATLIWPLLEIVTCLFNKKRRALHDFIAGTVVVKTKSIKQGFVLDSAKFQG